MSTVDHPSTPQFKPGDEVTVLVVPGAPEVAGRFICYPGAPSDLSVVRIEAEMASEDPRENTGKHVKLYLFDIRYLWVRRATQPGLRGV